MINKSRLIFRAVFCIKRLIIMSIHNIIHPSDKAKPRSGSFGGLSDRKEA
nr:MAG TPA: hypothetical protein [Bacteriophage sp.]